MTVVSEHVINAPTCFFIDQFCRYLVKHDAATHWIKTNKYFKAQANVFYAFYVLWQDQVLMPFPFKSSQSKIFE